MIRMFATFNGCTRGPSNGSYLGPPLLQWTDIVDTHGNEVPLLISNKSKLTEKLTFRKGNRYMIDCHSVSDGKIKRIKAIKGVKKKNVCNLFEPVANDFKITHGKHKGKMVSEMSKTTIGRFLDWIDINSNNEVTLANVRKIRKVI